MAVTISSRIFVHSIPNPATLIGLRRRLFPLSVSRLRIFSAMAHSDFKKVQIQRDDTVFDAYVVGKEDAPGIVVLQEWWGVDFEIKNHALKISQFGSGYRALIPDLYRGKVGLDVAVAQHLMDGLDWQGAVKDIRASVNWLKANGSKKDPFETSSEDIDVHKLDGLAHAKVIWDRWRSDLHTLIKKNKGKEQVIRNTLPDDLSQHYWNYLLDNHYFTEEFQKRSAISSRNRQKVRYVHRSGSKPYTQVEREMEETLGRPPTYLEMFRETHTSKATKENPTPMPVPMIQEKIKDIERVLAENPEIDDFGLTETVFGPQGHGRVIGMRSGVRITNFREDRRGGATHRGTQALRDENQSLRAEVQELRAEQATMRAEQASAQAAQAAQAVIQAQMSEYQKQLAFLMSHFAPPPPSQ